MTDTQPRGAHRPDPGRGKDKAGAAALLCVILAAALIALSAPMVMGSLGSEPSDGITQVRVVIDYAGNWSGALGSSESSASHNGTGPASFTVLQDSTGSILVSAVIQKQDDSHRMLKVSIETMDSRLLQVSGTIRPYGSVTVGWTNL